MGSSEIMARISDTLNLPPRQRLFVTEYLKDFNGTQAAIRAGYSRRSARSIANEHLTKPDIRNALAKAVEERCTQTGLDATWLLTRLVEEVNADIADLFNDDGALKPMQEWPAVWRRGLVVGIEVEEIDGGENDNRTRVAVLKKLKFSDRVRRLELIGRHVDVGAFRDKVRHELASPLAELAQQIMGRSIKPHQEGP